MNKKTESFKNIITVLLTMLLLGIASGPASAANPGLISAKYISDTDLIMYFNKTLDNADTVDETKITVTNNAGTPIAVTNNSAVVMGNSLKITTVSVGSSTAFKIDAAGEGLDLAAGAVAHSGVPTDKNLESLNNSVADGQAPTVALNYSSNPAKAGSMTLTAAYSEAIVGTPKISINQSGTTNITTQNMTNSGDQTVWTYSYTVNTANDGTYVDGTATVGLSTVSDATLNNACAPTGTTFTIDTTAPTVALNYSSNPAKAGTMTVTATYSGSIVGTPAISINQPGSTDITTQDMANSGDQTVWTYLYTVNTTNGGTYIDGTAIVSLSTVADAATNNASSPTGTIFTIDTTAPTVALNYSANPAKAGAMTVTATYSEVIVGTPTISIDQPGSTDITTQAMSGGATVWTYAYTVNTANGGAYIDGISTVSLSTVADAATNNVSSSTGTTFTIDTTAPSVEITAPTAGTTVKGTSTVSFTDTDLTSAQCSIDNTAWVACTSAVTTLSEITGFNDLGEVAFTLYLKDTDAAGNVGTDTAVILKDTTAPTVALSYSANPAKAGSMTITATYSEAIVGTPAISINQPGTTDITAQAMSGGATVWTYSYAINTANGGTYIDGTSTVSLSAVADIAGYNAGTPSGTTFTIDTAAPTVALSYSANPAKAGAMTITATYSEVIVDTPAISINQPGTTDITTQDMIGGATVWTYAYTVNTATGGSYIDGTSTVSLSTVADAATNNAGAPTGTTFTIDTTAPTFTAARTALNTIVLTFSENVDVTTTAGQGYTLSSGTVTANTDPAGSGNTITLTTSGVSGTPTVTYGAAAGTTVDTAANEAADGFSAVSSSGSAASIVVTASNTSPMVNATVTINVTVKDSSGLTSGSLGNGTISFLANGIGFASATLSDGVASTTYTKATAGAVTITAFYNTTLQNITTVTFTAAVIPDLTVSASPANVKAGMPTNVTFNVTSNGTARNNATVTLSGVAIGSGTTNTSGLVIIRVNATSAGTITATAKMSGYNDGTTIITAEAATPENEPPVIAALIPLSVTQYETVPLTATASDPEGQVLYYAWDLDNDGVFEIGRSTTNTLYHIFSTNGTNTIRVHVDDGVESTEKSFNIIVASATIPYSNDNDPVIVSISPVVLTTGSPMTVTITATDADAGTILYYAWDLDGNGEFESGRSTDSTNSITIGSTRVINVQVDDGIRVTTKPVTIAASSTGRNSVPIFNAAIPTTATVNVPTTFTLNATDNDIFPNPISYMVDADNSGTYDPVFVGSTSTRSTINQVNITFTTTGSHIVPVRVDDGVGITTSYFTVVVS